MAMLTTQMRDAGIPFRTSADGMLLYKPEYRAQVEAIDSRLNRPYVDAIFERDDYAKIYLAQLLAMNRSYHLYTTAGKQAVRWWPESPDEPIILNDQVAVAWQKAQPTVVAKPCDRQAKPSNRAPQPDARTSASPCRGYRPRPGERER
ncbi:MAG TPA: hypothetical protein VFK92_09345 [Burkholderiales bacterium]|nr:hypothetical protein [Burkholderiales bacterium]